MRHRLHKLPSLLLLIAGSNAHHEYVYRIVDNVSDYVWANLTDFSPADAKQRAAGATASARLALTELDRKLSTVMEDVSHMLDDKKTPAPPSKKSYALQI